MTSSKITTTQRACHLLVSLRKRARMTQAKLAGQLDISKTTLSNWENGRSPIATDKLAAIATALSLSPKELHTLTVARLPALVLGKPDRPKADALLAAYRQRAGMSQDELAARLGVTKTSICYWETGQVQIDGGKLNAIAAALRLSADESDDFTFARWPALDPVRPTGQDQHKQAGLHLAASRERAGLTQHMLAERLGVTQRTIVDWESGITLLNANRLLDAADALALTHEDRNRLVQARWPAFDGDWLERQPEGKRASLFLTACRERAGYTQAELAQAIGVSVRTVLRWEDGVSAVPGSKAATLAAHYRNLSITLPEFLRWFAVSDSEKLKLLCATSGEVMRNQ